MTSPLFFPANAGNQVLCCDRCPNVAHLRCLGRTTLPDTAFVCRNCKITGRNRKSAKLTAGDDNPGSSLGYFD